MDTRNRPYDIDGYEREVWIDPQRNIGDVVGGGGGASRSSWHLPRFDGLCNVRNCRRTFQN